MVGTTAGVRDGAGVSRMVRCAMVGAVVFAMAWVAGAGAASAASTACASAPSYGVGISIIPEFVGTSTIAVTAYPGEVLDYSVTVFLRKDAPGTPNGVTVCPIVDATITVKLPNGAGPFTVATGVALPVGGSVTFAHVPTQKYTMSTADVVPAPGCGTGSACYDRVEATAHVEATSEGPDDGPQDDDPVQATATAPTFLLAPSTRLTLSPASSTINDGESIQWTATETNDTPARYFPLTLSAVHVDLSTDGGVTAFARLDATTANFSGDTNTDGLLEVGETWRWTFTTTPAADATLTATGFGTGARGRIVTFPADAEERAASAVVVTPTTIPATTVPATTTPPTTAPPATSPPTTAPPATAPPTTVAPEAAPPEAAPPTTVAQLVAPPTPFLPETGTPSSTVGSLVAGMASVTGGLLLVVVSRRRRAARPVR
jgi:LPXTG-motif cell wall-anchored protein